MKGHFVQVIEAVRDYAFVNTPYPVIISFENHCRHAMRKMID